MIYMTFQQIGVTAEGCKTNVWALWDVIRLIYQQMTVLALFIENCHYSFRGRGPPIEEQEMIYPTFRHIGMNAEACKTNVWVCWDLIPLGNQQMTFLAQIQQNICCRMWASGPPICGQETIHMTFWHIGLPHEGCETNVCMCRHLIPLGHEQISLSA